jgi:histone-lysine N-methyltransferase EZH2
MMLTSSQVKLVNGEHRIGIYSTQNLESGSELWIDYGPEFFKNPAGSPDRRRRATAMMSTP